MIILKNPVPSVNSQLCSQIHSKGCPRLRNGCELHSDAADSVLTCGWTIMSQQIWKKIFITGAILHILIKIEKSSTGKWSMYITISGWHTFYFGDLFVIRWCRWCSGPWWSPSWWRCTRAFVPPSCWGLVCSAILATKAAICLIFTNHCLVPFDRNLHLVMAGKLNSPLLLFLAIGARFLD
jgi:hypothetical protein